MGCIFCQCRATGIGDLDLDRSPCEVVGSAFLIEMEADACCLMAEGKCSGFAILGSGSRLHQVVALLIAALVGGYSRSCRLSVTVWIPCSDADVTLVRAIEGCGGSVKLQRAASIGYLVLLHLIAYLYGYLFIAIPCAVCGGTCFCRGSQCILCGNKDKWLRLGKSVVAEVGIVAAGSHRHQGCDCEERK